MKAKAVRPTGAKIVKKAKPTIELKKAKKLKGAPATEVKKKKAAVSGTKNTKKSSGLNKKQLEGLKDIDPEFYSFLQQNDKDLLEFNLFDSDDDDDELLDAKANGKKVKAKASDKNKKSKKQEEEDESEDEDDASAESGSDDEDDTKLHKPSAKLEVASDESDYEDSIADDDDEDDDGKPTSAHGSQKVTLNLLRQWQAQLEQTNVSIEVVRQVIQAFNSALASITTDSKEAKTPTTPYQVVGASAFNGVVQLCVLYLQPAIMRFLGLTAERSGTPPHKTKKWVKVRSCLRYYLTDLIRLIEQVSGANLLAALLKHLHQMAGMVASYSNLSKMIFKRLIVLWSTSDETVRVLAFLCILKITRNQQVSMLNHVLKAMYLSYVRNSKFVSPNTLPGINFMRRSLVEMFALDLNVTYHHAFLYIRQLAIHLRNAVILQKKDSFQAVYNWQYINSLRLWIDLLGATANKPQLQPLLYPLVTIIFGVVRLVPTAQYFPLRFHCLQMLIALAKQTHVFIPVLPYILEVLRSNTFNAKHTAVSMRPQQFACILRLNKAQLSENGFRDEVIEQICGLTLEYLTHESAALAFSDLIAPTVITLKEYLKNCRNANYTRKLKQVLDKMQENARFIEQERNKITFGLKDTSQIEAWETQMRNKGTPLAIYYSSWLKTHEMKKRRQAAQTDSINADYDLPTIKRTQRTKAAKNENDGEVELFPSDSEDDEIPDKLIDGDDDEENEAKPTATKRASKNKDNVPAKKPKTKKSTKQREATQNDELIDDDEVNNNDHIDIVKDLDLDDW